MFSSSSVGAIGASGADHRAHLVPMILAREVREATVARNDVEYDFAAFKFQPEMQLAQPSLAHRFAQLRFALLAIKHKEPSTASARNFSANRSMIFRKVVPRF